MRIRLCGALLALLCSVTAVSADAQDLFPRPAALEPAVRFWTRVYTEVETNGGFIHDSLRLDVVYETIRFPDGASRRERRDAIEQAYDKYRGILATLARGKRDGLSAEQARVLALWPADVDNAELERARERLRFQLGQANRFRAGMIRSGAWKPYIHRVLAEHGLPAELAALPHVESSFDPTAYSKVGAAGMWQFTRSTGLRYMQIDHIVDERRDPFLSTRAAAQLLEYNYSVIESWPLALTAYNHGLAGMRRAARELGTKAIETIVERYRSRSFGFASRNFYVAFLAAVDVDSDPQRYFGALRPDPPADLDILPAPDYVNAASLARALGISERELRRYNPALMDPVWSGDKFVPRGFELRFPRRPTNPAELLAAIPSSERYVAQRPDIHHRVRSGDTLSQIAEQYGVSLAALTQLNGLRSRNLIRVGQVLTLPSTGGSMPPTLAGGDTVQVALSDGVYTVRPGDSIARISRTLGVDEQTLLAHNDIRDRHRIYVGQQLRISHPGAEAAPAAEARVEQAAAEVPAAAAREPLPLPRIVAASAGEASQPDSPPPPAESPAVAQPAPAEDEDALDSNVLASVQADLAADPSNYTVADGRIEVQALETLGHYADWLGIRTQRLRDLNGMRFGEAVVIGQQLELDFSRVDPATFEQRRSAYQSSMQEAFFSAYQIADVSDHVIAPGESVWVLASRRYNVPVWLLRQFNPDLDLHHVHPGTVVKFPALRPIGEPNHADSADVTA